MFVNETLTYFTPKYESNLSVDSVDTAIVTFAFDLTMHDIPCANLKFRMLDFFGDGQQNDVQEEQYHGKVIYKTIDDNKEGAKPYTAEELKQKLENISGI